MRRALLAFGLLTAVGSLAWAQSKPERFWLAGRYDGNRVLIYFDAVKFGKTLPADAPKLPPAVVDGFFGLVRLPASYVARYQADAGSEHFSLGDQYDLLLSRGEIVTATLTTLIGTEGDEQTGNNSFIGALATVSNPDYLLATRGYYALRRHREGTTALPTSQSELPDEPARFSTQTRILSLLTAQARCSTGDVSPGLQVQMFRLANGGIRYYARAEWKPAGKDAAASCAVAAWLTATPELRVLKIDRPVSRQGFHYLPDLRNVVDLGQGRTGIIVCLFGEDSRYLKFLEYRDGAGMDEMRVLQSIDAGE